jgi:hypothetical protein
VFVKNEDASQSRLVGMELDRSTSIVQVMQLGNATRELNSCPTKQGRRMACKATRKSDRDSKRSVFATCSHSQEKLCNMDAAFEEIVAIRSKSSVQNGEATLSRHAEPNPE